jgi:peptide/nickel transport system substrate-binding protein
MISAFVAGELDVMRPVSASELAALAKRPQNRLVANASGADYVTWIDFNWDHPTKGQLFANPNFRKAMSRLVDRKAMIDFTYGSFGTATYTGVYARDRQWIASDVKRYDYDPAVAVTMLQSLGLNRRGNGWFYAGKPLSLSVLYDAADRESEQNVALWVKAASLIGLRIIPDPQENGSYYSRLDGGNFELAINNWQGGFKAYPIIPVLPCDSGVRSHHRQCTLPWERAWDKLYRSGLETLDRGKRIDIAKELQRLENKELPFVYLPSPNRHYAFSDRLQGLFPKAQLGAFGYGIRELLWVKP